MKMIRITKDEAVRMVKELLGHEDPEVRKVVERIARKFKLSGASVE